MIGPISELIERARKSRRAFSSRHSIRISSNRNGFLLPRPSSFKSLPEVVEPGLLILRKHFADSSKTFFYDPLYLWFRLSKVLVEPLVGLFEDPPHPCCLIFRQREFV